jgi:hypothetical protein
MDRLRQDTNVLKAFSIVSTWVPAWRYSAELSNREDANDFLNAIAIVSRWIEHSL